MALHTGGCCWATHGQLWHEDGIGLCGLHDETMLLQDGEAGANLPWRERLEEMAMAPQVAGLLQQRIQDLWAATTTPSGEGDWGGLGGAGSGKRGGGEGFCRASVGAGSTHRRDEVTKLALDHGHGQLPHALHVAGHVRVCLRERERERDG